MIKAKQRSSFSVSFEGDALSPLEKLTLAVDLGTEVFDQVGASTHRTNTVILWLADDVENQAMTAVRSWLEAGNQPFRLVVKVFVDNVPKDMFVFDGAVLHALQHSIFTREDQAERVDVFDFRGSNKQFTAVINQAASRESSAKLLQIAFGEMQHHIMDGIQ